MDARKLSYLKQIGVLPWQLRNTPNCQQDTLQSVEEYAATKEEQLIDTLPDYETAPHHSWEALRLAVASCKSCELHKTRTQTVFGVGNPNADLMFIGEAPGFYEDQKGEPFVGRAGQLLNAMLQAIGMARDQVFIANILKCRPANNRDPSSEEVQQCTPFLEKQIAFIKPKLLVALGRIAAHYLLNTKTPLTQLRGKIYAYGSLNTPLIVTYHPAYLLRNPRDKGKAFQDLNTVIQQL